MKVPVNILVASFTPRYEEIFIYDTQVMPLSVPGMKAAYTITVGPWLPNL